MSLSVTVNGNRRAIAEPALAVLVDELTGGRPGVAVAVNDAVVPRADWDGFQLHENDRIEVLHAVQGG